MVPRTATHIARPLPPTRPVPPTPPRGTIYVVERFGRFSRLLPGNGPPLLPLVDRVIAAYAKRVEQATPPEGLLALLAASLRVIVNANWSIRVTDPRKLAYRVSDVDRCVDMLIHVRIRDTLSTLPPTIDIHDPAVLKRISEAIRLGVDGTAARFGVSCPQFEIIAIRMAEEKPQRSLNLAETIRASDSYANEIDSVLPELPRDATQTATNSFSSLPPVTQPAYINYPQPIAYPQPIQPLRKKPALASVRLPPPQPTRQPSITETHESDDDSLVQLHNSQKQPQSQSLRELPSTSPEEPDTESVALGRNYAPSRSLPQLIISDEDELPGMNQVPAELETQSLREIRSSDDETLRAAKSVLAMHTSEKASPFSEDDGVKPLPALPFNIGVQELLLQELPRDISSLSDEITSTSLPEKREILYAPPPSPIASEGQASSSSVSPKVLSAALTSDIRKPSSGVASESPSPSSERTFKPPQTRLLPTEQPLSQVERESPSEERPPPLLERILHASGRKSPPPQSTSPLPERSSPPSERKLPTTTQVSHTADRGLPTVGQISPPTERLPSSSPLMSPAEGHALLKTELADPPTERAVPMLEQGSAQAINVSPMPERALPDQLQLLGTQERSSSAARLSSSSGSVPEGFSPPLVNIFKTATPTPPSELPESERGSDSSPSDTHDGSLRSPPESSPTEPPVGTAALENPASESPTEFKDAVDHPVPSPLMLNPVYRPPESMERDGQNPQLPPLVRSTSNKQSAPTSQSRQASTSLPLRAGVPLLGPPMIPDPTEALRGHQPVYQKSTNSSRGLQTAARGMAPQGYLSPSLPPRAPTSLMIPLSPPEHNPIGAPYGSGLDVQTSPVMAEGLGISSASQRRPLPMGVGDTHPAEVGSRVKRAVPRGGPQQVDGTGRGDHMTGEDYPGTQYARDNGLGSDSDDTSVATRGRSHNSSPLTREQRKRRQYVQTASLFSTAAGKSERTIKSSTTPTSSGQQTATRSARTGLSAEQLRHKPDSIHEGAQVGAVNARHLTTNISQGAKANAGGLRGRETLRNEAEYERDDAHLRRDGKRLRTAEEEETLFRRERAQRDRQMNEFDMTHRKGREGRESSDDDSTRMMIDGGSDEERERFNENSMYEAGAHSRRRRQKTRSRRNHVRRIDPIDDSDDSSSDEACTECGHQHEGHGNSSSRRKGKSRSKSSRSDGSHHDRYDDESEPRSVSRSRSGRSRKGTSESSVDSHRSSRASSRDQRSKKSSSRDRKIEKTSSTSRSRSRDAKRSHSKSRSSSRKRDGDDKKRKDSSKSKSKSRDKREVPTQEQLEYKSKRTALKSVYRHRLPESDSGPENPIPWYCEGQSQPEDTDLDDYEGPDSSDSEDEKRAKSTSTMYSSYGRRDRYGRRHRAHHNRNVTFLYDNRR